MDLKPEPLIAFMKAKELQQQQKDEAKVSQTLREIVEYVGAERGLVLKKSEGAIITSEMRGKFYSFEFREGMNPLLMYKDKILQVAVNKHSDTHLLVELSIERPYLSAELARMVQWNRTELEGKIVIAFTGSPDVRHVQIPNVDKNQLIAYFLEITTA
jgi:hypothetical protein